MEDLFDSPTVLAKKASPYQQINLFKEDADMDFDCLRVVSKDLFGGGEQDLMPLTSSETKSISKNDITELENKIKCQER